MRFSVATVAAVAALVPGIAAHYNFNALIVDGETTEEYVYVRKNTNSNSPVTDVTSKDIRCNVGGLESASSTKTKEVAPGSKVGFTVMSEIGHPGPLQVYMSKADTTAAEYDGSGDWFKVYEMGVKEVTDNGLQWESDGLTNFTFPLSEQTPPGEYLLRVEHIGLHGASEFGGAQFYISCAQIKVTGSGAGEPSPTVKFPGAYTGKEEGIEIGIYYPIPTNYQMPGPAVWPAGSGESSSSGSSSATPAASSASAAETTSQAAAATNAAQNVAVSTPVAAQPTPSAQVMPTPVVVPSAANTPVFTPPANTPVSTPGAGGAVKKFGQCGGSNYQGSTECESGSTCKNWNDYYSQCV